MKNNNLKNNSNGYENSETGKENINNNNISITNQSTMISETDIVINDKKKRKSQIGFDNKQYDINDNKENIPPQKKLIKKVLINQNQQKNYNEPHDLNIQITNFQNQDLNSNLFFQEFSSSFKKKVHVSDYLDFENDNILTHYGSEIFKTIKIQEIEAMVENLLSKHKVSSEIRTKMVDWILEVFNVYYFSHQTFFTTINIIDAYIIKTTKILTDNDIHLIGMVAMLIATKFDESSTIKMENLIDKIGHKTFSKEQILKKEIEVMETLESKGIVSTSALECINSFFYDFLQNNSQFVEKFKMFNFIKKFEAHATFYAKLILHFENFNAYQACYKALGCIVVAFDSVKLELINLNMNEEHFYLKEWVKFILKENRYKNGPDLIYKLICEAVETYWSLDYIGRHLPIQFQREIDSIEKKKNEINKN